MKSSLKTLATFVLGFTGLAAFSQSDSLGMPGDNLDLRAVLSIFKQSTSIEEFERKLNAADSKVNNLDLNNDKQVDYLRVVDHAKDNFHSIVIQTPISKSETQDVAVIEIEKKDDKVAHVQIVGDETLYGKDYIIEPKTEAQAKALRKDSKSYDDDVYSTSDTKSSEAKKTRSEDYYDNNDSYNDPNVMVNVWGWPSVAYIYSPGYSLWVSPWYWGYYPGWYSPWAPYGWGYYHRGFIGWNYGFYGYRTNVYAFPRAHNYYYGRRTTSGYVNKTAPNYGGRRNEGGGYNRGNNGRIDRRGTAPREGGRINTNPGNNNNNQGGRIRRGGQNNGGQNGGGQRMNRGSGGGSKVAPSNNGGGRMNGGGGSGGGGTRSGGGGGGGGRSSGGGAIRR